jgi:hypothetical protein
MEMGGSFTHRPLYHRERAPGTYWIGGWLGPRAVLDAVIKRKLPSPRREWNPNNDDDNTLMETVA